MYSASKVESRIDQAISEFHFTPVYHSVADVDGFEHHLVREGRYHFNDVGRPDGLQNLSAEDRQWMLNEQVLCMCDAAYALTRYAYIKSDQNIVQRFTFRVPQRILFDILSDLESGNRTLEIMILKARQLGMSTLVELLISLRIIFAYGVNAIIGSADQTKTGLMAGILFLAYDMMPFWLKPMWTRRVESDHGMLVFGQNMSGVSFQHGSQMSGIARGTTPTIYHLSEIASFTDAEDQIESSLFRCVHPSPSVLGVLESSGEGDKGWWPDTWRSSRDNWASGGARLCPLFLPWFCGVELYPNHQWITHDHPIPYGWRPNKDTLLHIAKCELYVQSSPMLRRHLGEQWRMPTTQQWFWEFGHEEAKRKGTQSKWYQEMCADDEEALQHSVVSVFGHDTIAAISSARERSYSVYGLSGQSIEADHEPDPADIDYSRERIVTRYISPRGDAYRWELIPLQFNPPLRETSTDDAEGKLFIFHHPRPAVSYSIGVDTSQGVGQDSTVISVWTCGSKGQQDIQVAEFASSRVNHVEAFAFVMAIASLYRTHMAVGVTRWREPYVSIEQIKAVGDTCQFQMAKMGYSNFHRFIRYDGKRPNKQSATRRGWFTNAWSRPLLTGHFVNASQNGWAQINSPWMIEEMKLFERHVTSTGKEKLEHEDGACDDRIFAAAMAIFCPHDLDVLADRSKKHPVEPSTLPPIDLSPFAEGLVINPAVSRFRDSPVLTLEDILYSGDDTLRRNSY